MIFLNSCKFLWNGCISIPKPCSLIDYFYLKLQSCVCTWNEVFLKILKICFVIVDYWKTWLKLVMLENLQACFILTWPQFPSLWIQLTPFAEQQPLWISAFKKFVCFEDLFIFFVCARVDWVTVFSCLYQPYELQW